MITPWIHLESAVVFMVSGKDARRYLHNRLSNNIRGLTVGQALEAAALSAQGRAEGFFSICCLADDRFVLVCDGGESESLQAALGKFIVADRVTLENITNSAAVLHIGLDPARLEELGIYSPEQCVAVIPCRRIAQAGSHVLIKREELPAVTKPLQTACGESITTAMYNSLRWDAAVPVYPTEINSEVILTECGMRHAVSFTKGCYVGQEVLERSDAIGRLPRTLERLVLSGNTVVACGVSIENSEGASIGKVISSFVDSERAETRMFALLKTGKYVRGDTVQCMGHSATIM
jgi:folate-binding protein YgfZ